jgi:hypothetical protein
MYRDDDAIVKLQRHVQRLADKHGASVYSLRDDKELLIMLLSGDVESAEATIISQYAYCDECDDNHGVCEVN